jgi:hypothetical protein
VFPFRVYEEIITEAIFSVQIHLIRPAFLASVIRAEQLWKFVSSHDYVIGDFMWTGIDILARQDGKKNFFGCH